MDFVASFRVAASFLLEAGSGVIKEIGKGQENQTKWAFHSIFVFAAKKTYHNVKRKGDTIWIEEAQCTSLVSHNISFPFLLL